MEKVILVFQPSIEAAGRNQPSEFRYWSIDGAKIKELRLFFIVFTELLGRPDHVEELLPHLHL